MKRRLEPLVAALRALAERTKAKPDQPPTFSGAHDQLHGQVYRLYSAVEALGEVNDARNPTETEAAHIKYVATTAKRMAKEVAAADARIGAIYRDGFLAIEKSIDQRVKLIPDAYANEIRAVFRGMKSEDQFKHLHDLVSENRGPELAALTRAPGVLSGLQAEMQKRYEQAIRARHAPEEVDAHKALSFAHENALVALRTAKEIATEYEDRAQLAEIKAAEDKAADAAMKFLSNTGEVS